MFELIDPAYPDAASDERLVPILSEIMKLQTEIQSAQWEGRDATALSQRLRSLNKSYMDGAVYEPQFSKMVPRLVA